MVTLGYVLSSEEHSPRRLVELAAAAEEAGFSLGLISDHFHPWTEKQGESGFVWSVIGAIGEATREFRIGTGVTCPLFRNHPVLIAHAAATLACLIPGRFFLGLGTGERLNEHVLGQGWPRAATRLEMLVEAITIIRRLWSGQLVNHRGRYFEVEDARLYSLPQDPPPLYVAASGPMSARQAGEAADGLICPSPNAEVVADFRRGGNSGPRLARVSLCYAETREQAIQTAKTYWPNGALHGQFMLDLSLPRDIENVAEYLGDDEVERSIVCGPDPEQHVQRIQAYIDAGFDEICLHQTGPDQEAFLSFAAKEILPRFAGSLTAKSSSRGNGRE